MKRNETNIVCITNLVGPRFLSSSLPGSTMEIECEEEGQVGAIVVFLFKDSEGFADSIAAALNPNPSSSTDKLLKPLEVRLGKYGVGDQVASGHMFQFVQGGKPQLQLSVVTLDHYEPPILACAVNEVLDLLIAKRSSTLPTLVAPFFIPSSKLKPESRLLPANNSEIPLYGIQIGPETDVSQSLAAKTLKAPPFLQIHYEPLACFLQLVRCLNIPTFILVGQRSENPSAKESSKEIIGGIGELLANLCNLSFFKENIKWNPTKSSRDRGEPWRALYG